MLMTLEFLSQHEVEIAATLLTEDLVEAITPVNAHHTNHGQEDAGTHACRALDVEGVEVLDISPCVTTLDEHERVNRGALREHQREVQLYGEAVIGVTLRAVGCERTILIAAQGNGLGSVGIGT